MVLLALDRVQYGRLRCYYSVGLQGVNLLLYQKGEESQAEWENQGDYRDDLSCHPGLRAEYLVSPQ